MWGADVHNDAVSLSNASQSADLLPASHLEPLQQQHAQQSEESQILPSIPSSQPSIVSHQLSAEASDDQSSAHVQSNMLPQQTKEALFDDQAGSHPQQQQHPPTHHHQEQHQQQAKLEASHQPADAQQCAQSESPTASQQHQSGMPPVPDLATRVSQGSLAESANQEGRPVAMFASAVTGAGLQELLHELDRKVGCWLL